MLVSRDPDRQVSSTMCVEEALESAKALLERAKHLGAVQSGNFTLSSGQPSNLYFDGRLLSVDPTCVEIISELFLTVLNANDLQYFGGPAVGAVPILGGMALRARLEDKEFAGFFVRREAKQHGMYRQIEGLFKDGATVAVYDDTISTGQSLLETIAALENRHVTFKMALCILDRRQGGSDALEQKHIPLFNILVRDDDQITVDEEKIRYWFSSESTCEKHFETNYEIGEISFGAKPSQEANEELLIGA